MQIKIGADPELFVKRAGVNVSGHDMIPGTKKRPFKVERGAVQVDGTALEFNIDPATTQEEFVGNVKAVLARLRDMVPPGHELALEAVARYEEEYFRNLPEVATAMGCDPDFDAYSGVEIERKGADRPFRTAAGHIHIGWTEGADPFSAQHYQSCRTLVKELDVWLGLPSVIFDPDSGPRRQLYGKAGSFRPKSYGVEYRVLSNKWLQSDELMGWVFRQTQAAFEHLMAGRSRPMAQCVNTTNLIHAINESDAKQAAWLLATAPNEKLVMPDGKVAGDVFDRLLDVKYVKAAEVRKFDVEEEEDV